MRPIILFAIVLLLAACAANSPTPASQSVPIGSQQPAWGDLPVTRLSANISRWIDCEAAVVCWSTPSGVACLPIQQTMLAIDHIVAGCKAQISK